MQHITPPPACTFTCFCKYECKECWLAKYCKQSIVHVCRELTVQSSRINTRRDNTDAILRNGETVTVMTVVAVATDLSRRAD